MPAMADVGIANPVVAPSEIGARRLALFVADAVGERCHVIRPDATIGRSPECEICIDHCDLRSVHARVVRDDSRGLLIRTTDARFCLTRSDGEDSSEIELHEGVEFKIGAVRFCCGGVFILSGASADDEDCAVAVLPPLALPALPADPVSAMLLAAEENEAAAFALAEQLAKLPPLRVSCPRCRHVLVNVPDDAAFCPKCGLPLPEYCPPWIPDAAADPSLAQRPLTLRAYVNTLVNLGLRFERGRASERNLPLAARYYEKAARLGSAAAQVRIGIGAAGRGDA
jgi:hypothetical protein